MKKEFQSLKLYDMDQHEQKNKNKVKIRLNIFDLTPLNKLLRFCHVGIYHSSIVIGDACEYYYGFAKYDYTGIDSPETIDKLPSSMSGENYTTINLGTSPFTMEECRKIIVDFRNSKRWWSDHYNFLYHNCHKFSYELACALLNTNNPKKYPKWITRGEKVGHFLYQTSLSHILNLATKAIPGFGSSPTVGMYKLVETFENYETEYKTETEELQALSLDEITDFSKLNDIENA